jgi:hypothetical protein
MAVRGASTPSSDIIAGMSDAFFYKGLTIEYEERAALLRIEGNRIPVERHPKGFQLQLRPHSKASSLLEVGKAFIDGAREYKGRTELRKKHLKILNRGKEYWNDWRRDEPQIRPLLYNATLGEDIRIKDFCEIDFSWAGLAEADLTGADLTRANFFQAHLGRTVMKGATLNEAHFCRADLYETNLSGAFLEGANLQGAQLAKTNLAGAHLKNCAVYGMAAWDVDLKNAEQKNLIVRYRCGTEERRSGTGMETEITVDDLQVAQFIYLMLDNPKIKVVLDEGTKRSVLILGRFADEARKKVLDELRERLRQIGYVPIIFDFPPPKEHDLIQTVAILASLSRFVLGDITDARSVALEFEAILSRYRIPVVPIILAPGEPFSLLASMQDRHYPCVLEVRRYASPSVLFRNLEQIVHSAIDQESMIADGRLRVPHAIVELRE